MVVVLSRAMAMNDSKPGSDRTTRTGWVMAGASWQFVTEVLAGALLGWGVDWYFGVRPWGIVIGAVCGFAVGMLTFVRRTLALERSLGPVQRPPGGWKSETKDQDEDEDQDGDEPPRRAKRDEPHGGPR